MKCVGQFENVDRVVVCQNSICRQKSCIMSDHKRANLITVDSTKKTKQSARKTIRIALDLFESNEKECPEFNYKELVRAEEGHRRAEKEKKTVGGQNGLRDPFSDNDEDVERIAKQFEQKYGGSSTYGRRKGRCKQDEYADIGAGYDENDSFIDNTDGYDEMIPPECDTVCGGFYINSGSLEFKNVVGVGVDLDESSLHHRKTNKRALSSSESEEESSSSDEESEASTGEKRRHSEEGERNNGKVTDSDKSGEDRKKHKLSKSKEIDGKDNNLPRKKRKDSQDTAPTLPVTNVPDQPAPALPTPTPTPQQGAKKTVKELLAEARSSGAETNVEGSTDSRSSDSSCKAPAVPSSDNPVSSDSSRDAVPGTTCSTPQAPPPPPIPPLPPGLPPEAATLARRLKALAEAHFSSHTGKLAGAEVNEIILGMEKHCRRGTVTPSVRHALFSHAAALLRRGKPGLIQRARRLADDHQRLNTSKTSLDRLKVMIEKMKPALLENYKMESQRILETNKNIALQNSTVEDDKKLPEKRLPKRRFPWNDQVRAALSDILKEQGVGDEEDGMSHFLQRVVLPLFPSGFVRMPTLIQQAKLGKTPKSLNDKPKNMANKSYESKQNNCQLNKSSNKTYPQMERSISDPEVMAPTQPRTKPVTSSICIGTDAKDTEPKEHHYTNQLSDSFLENDKNRSFKIHNDGGSASPMIGDNVSISVTSVFQKMNEGDLKSSPSPPKTDKYVHPTTGSSITITPVVNTSQTRDPKLFQATPEVNNSVTITAKPMSKPSDASPNISPTGQHSPGTIKVKPTSALFDKNTIAKIISGKNTHGDSSNKTEHKDNRDRHIKSHNDQSKSDKMSKSSHGHSNMDILSKPNSLPASPLPMLSKAYLGTSDPKMEDLKPSHPTTNNDMFIKPKYKTDHSSHHHRSSSSSNTMHSSSSSHHKSPEQKNSEINKYHREMSKSPHSDKSYDHLNISPMSKGMDRSPTSPSSMSVLKQHRIQKKYDSLPQSPVENPRKLSYGDPHRKSAESLSVDDSSSDDCVEIVLEDGYPPKKSKSYLYKDDDARRREQVRREVERQYKVQHDNHVSEKNSHTSDFSIKNIVEDKPYSVKSILKSPHSSDHAETGSHSVIQNQPEKTVLKYPNIKKTAILENEPELKKFKQDSSSDFVERRKEHPSEDRHNRITPSVLDSNSVKCETVSVIKDNFVSKLDRYNMERVQDGKPCDTGIVNEDEEKYTALDLELNRVMQDLKELQDLQKCSPEDLHQRLYDESTNKIYGAGPYPPEKTTIFNNAKLPDSSGNILKTQTVFLETSSSHNLTTGSLH